jgi:hypothetical protein
MFHLTANPRRAIQHPAILRYFSGLMNSSHEWYRSARGRWPRSTRVTRADADRDADDIRSWHELAETQDVREFLLTYPLALLDGDANASVTPTGGSDFATAGRRLAEQQLLLPFLCHGWRFCKVWRQHNELCSLLVLDSVRVTVTA